MRAELRDSLESLFADSRVSARPCRTMTVDVARGGTAAVHVLLNDLPKNARLAARAWCPDGLRGDWFRLIDVPVTENTGLNGFTERTRGRNPYVVRRAPFRVFDAMEPIRPPLEAAGPTLALRLHVPVPAGRRAGRYECPIELRCGAREEALALTVVVHKPAIPPVGRKSWPNTNWFSYDNIASRHGLRIWSPAYWRMLRRYADGMARARQNTFICWLKEIFRPTPRGPVLDRERLRRIVRTFTDAGMWFIEGGHFAGRTDGVWEAKTFSVTGGGPPIASPEGHKRLASMARQLREEIEANGWRDRWIQHAADEPLGENVPDYRVLVGMVHKYMPGLPVLDAVEDTLAVGAPDIWCPKDHDYQNHRPFFEAQRAYGDRIWFYTCCKPGGRWLNRLLDQELIRSALLGWAAAKFGLDGFLHWGLNWYRKEQDPFRETVIGWGRKNSLPAGDTHVVYPGKDGPWSSLRLEAQREGFEDLELLRVLQARRPAAARRIIAGVVRGFDRYTTDVRRFRAARKALLSALE